MSLGILRLGVWLAEVARPRLPVVLENWGIRAGGKLKEWWEIDVRLQRSRTAGHAGRCDRSRN